MIETNILCLDVNTVYNKYLCYVDYQSRTHIQDSHLKKWNFNNTRNKNDAILSVSCHRVTINQIDMMTKQKRALIL